MKKEEDSIVYHPLFCFGFEEDMPVVLFLVLWKMEALFFSVITLFS